MPGNNVFRRSLSTGCDVVLKPWLAKKTDVTKVESSTKNIRKNFLKGKEKKRIGWGRNTSEETFEIVYSRTEVDPDTYTARRISKDDKKTIQMTDTKSMTVLHHAVCRKYNNLVSEMLQNFGENEKASVLNAKDSNGKTALHYAVNSENPNLVKLLISHGADIEIEDNQKQRPLHCAIINGFPPTISELLKHELDINAVDEKNKTPLILAISSESLSITSVDELCERGADLNAKDRKGRTALHVACAKSSKETCMLLIKRGAAVHYIDNDNKTPFHYAITRFSNETIERFLENTKPTSKSKLLENTLAKENDNQMNEEFLRTLVKFEVLQFPSICRMHLQEALKTENKLLVDTIICIAAENAGPKKIEEAEKWISVLCQYSPSDTEKVAAVDMYRNTCVEIFLKHLTIASRSQLIHNAVETFDNSSCQHLKLLMQFELKFAHEHCHEYLTQALKIKNRVSSEIILNVVIESLNQKECPETELKKWMRVICDFLSLWKEEHPFYCVMSRLQKETIEAFSTRFDKDCRQELIKGVIKKIPSGSYIFVSELVRLEFLNNPSECSYFFKEALDEENELLCQFILNVASETSKEMKKLMHMVCNHLFYSKKERNIIDIWPACVDGQLTIIKSVSLKPDPGKIKSSYCRIPIAYKRHHALCPETFIVSYSDEEKENMEKIPANTIKELNQIMKKHAPNLQKNHRKLTIMSISSVRSTKKGTIRTPVPQKACIVLHCRHKGAIPFGEDEFPRSLDGYPVDVREGVFTLNSASAKKKNSAAPPPKAYHEKLRMGCSIGKKGQFSYGTLGGFFKMGDEIGFLTCAHVVADADILKSFSPNGMEEEENHLNPVVCQPADGHPGNENLTLTECGKVHTMVFTASIQDNNNATTVDATFVKITKEERKPQAPKFVGVEESSVEKAEFKGGVIPSRILPTEQFPPEDNKDIEVFKVGAATGFTQGSLGLFDVFILQESDITLGNDKRTFSFFQQREILNLQAGQPFFSCGDSGSLIFMVDEDDEDAIRCLGLAIGTCDPSNHCIFTPIDAVLSKFKNLEFFT